MVAANPSDDREIERKYLLRALPERVLTADSLEIDQGYIPGVRINERIRRTRGADGVRYYRTMKLGTGMDRLELEDDPAAAVKLAKHDITVQKEPADLRVLADAGCAAKDAEAVNTVREWISRYGLEDPFLKETLDHCTVGAP